MKPLTDPVEAGKAVAEAHADLQKQRHADTYRCVVVWLDALTAQHQAHAVTLPAERLADNQLRIRHLIALREALASTQCNNTGFVF